MKKNALTKITQNTIEYKCRAAKYSEKNRNNQIHFENEFREFIQFDYSLN